MKANASTPPMTMPPGNQACSAVSFAVLSLSKMVVMSGLTAASTSPLAMPMMTVARNRISKFGAKMVSSVPPMWPSAASRMMVPMPSRSHSGPPMKIDSPKPQNAAPAIQPTSVLFKWKMVSKSPMMSPRIANDIAVAISAMQLARKSRCLFMTVCALSEKWSAAPGFAEPGPTG